MPVALSLGSLCLEHCGLRRTPLSQATLAEQCLVRFAMPGTHYVAAQPSNGHPALLAVCVSEGGREQHEVRSHANPRLSAYIMLRL